MTLPLFKDFTKPVNDVFNDDFDYKFAVKVKSSAPYGVTLTTTTEHSSKGGATSLNGKLSAKWAHESGFVLDKLEVKPDGSLVTESSLNNLYPGLKLEFKGDDSFKGDLGAIYKCSKATAAAELDLVEFSSVKASVVTRAGPVVVGGAAELKTGDKAELKTLDVAASYNVNDIFVGLKTAKKFAKYDASVSYTPAKNYSIAGLFSFAPEKSTTSGALAVTWKCCPSTTVKGKVDSDGVLAVSVKETLAKTCSVVGAAEIDLRDPTAFRLGVVTTLG